MATHVVALRALLLAILSGPVSAADFTLEGLTFSDSGGGFVLEGATGRGTRDDPFVVVERVTGEGAAVLTVSGLGAAFGNRAGTPHVAGFALVKVVTNATTDRWTDYAVELQERAGTDSPYGDGLSFAQGPRVDRHFDSDRFATIGTTDEPRDGVVFGRGIVAPGETARFGLLVTDNTPAAVFHIVQRRHRPLALLLDGTGPQP
jgi:hypothetical protein